MARCLISAFLFVWIGLASLARVDERDCSFVYAFGQNDGQCRRKEVSISCKGNFIEAERGKRREKMKRSLGL